MKLTRRTLLVSGIASVALPRMAFDQGETIKIGVLHSLSGTVTISKTTPNDTTLMLIEARNTKGGLLGKQLEAVVVESASDCTVCGKSPRSFDSGSGRCHVWLLDIG